MQSIQRIGRGVQNAVNALARGVLNGINAAHKEKKDTLREAFVSEYNSVVLKLVFFWLSACQIFFTDPLTKFLVGPMRRPQRPEPRNPLSGVDPLLLVELLNKLKIEKAGRRAGGRRERGRGRRERVREEREREREEGERERSEREGREREERERGEREERERRERGEREARERRERGEREARERR